MTVVDAPAAAVALVAMPTTTLATLVHAAGTNAVTVASNFTLRRRGRRRIAEESQGIERADTET